MQIRDATEKDAHVIVELIQEMAAGSGETSPLTIDYVQSYLSSPVGSILLAIEDGQVLGLLSYSARPDLYHAGNCGLIEELVVRAGVRGQGVGSALLMAVLERARKGNWREVGLGVMPDNETAIKLYKKLGFTDEAILLEQHL